jgi:hypothetical protein
MFIVFFHVYETCTTLQDLFPNMRLSIFQSYESFTKRGLYIHADIGHQNKMIAAMSGETYLFGGTTCSPGTYRNMHSLMRR